MREGMTYITKFKDMVRDDTTATIPDYRACEKF